MEKLIEQFLEHLRYERNVSTHTLRNYASDIQQFIDFLAPADAGGKRRKLPELSEIDHLTIREWLAELHNAQKTKSSIARKLAALLHHLWLTGEVYDPLINTERAERQAA